MQEIVQIHPDQNICNIYVEIYILQIYNFVVWCNFKTVSKGLFIIFKPFLTVLCCVLITI